MTGHVWRRMALVITGLAVLAALAEPARADALVADLSSHLIGISSGFTGASVVLFGATDGAGDIVAIVRGPDREVTVRHKSKIVGVWVNTSQVTFAGVPSFYAVASSRPVEDAVSPAAAALYHIGIANLKIEPKRPSTPEAVALFAEALVRQQQRELLFPTVIGKVNFLGDRLFRTTFAFPANVPTGSYLIEVFLVRDKTVVSGQTTPLIVSQVGLDAEVLDFARRQALLYGAIAVLTAVMAGWLSSLPFRGI
jgi:uncharacterized protein (TIGR02186 family)